MFLINFLVYYTQYYLKSGVYVNSFRIQTWNVTTPAIMLCIVVLLAPNVEKLI